MQRVAGGKAQALDSRAAGAMEPISVLKQARQPTAMAQPLQELLLLQLRASACESHWHRSLESRGCCWWGGQRWHWLGLAAHKRVSVRWGCPRGVGRGCQPREHSA